MLLILLVDDILAKLNSSQIEKHCKLLDKREPRVSLASGRVIGEVQLPRRAAVKSVAASQVRAEERP